MAKHDEWLDGLDTWMDSLFKQPLGVPENNFSRQSKSTAIIDSIFSYIQDQLDSGAEDEVYIGGTVTALDLLQKRLMRHGGYGFDRQRARSDAFSDMLTVWKRVN